MKYFFLMLWHFWFYKLVKGELTILSNISVGKVRCSFYYKRKLMKQQKTNLNCLQLGWLGGHCCLLFNFHQQQQTQTQHIVSVVADIHSMQILSLVNYLNMSVKWLTHKDHWAVLLIWKAFFTVRISYASHSSTIYHKKCGISLGCRYLYHSKF